MPRGQPQFLVMTKSVRHIVALCVAFAALALPAMAQADPDAVVRDCAADGSVDGKHSDGDKKAALDRIPADLDEYSDCRSVIAASIKGPKAGASSRGGGDGDASGGVAGKADKVAAAKKRRARAKRLKERKQTELALGGRKADPKDPAVFEASNTSNGLPTPVLLALIALGLMGAAGGVMALGRHNRRFAATLRRVSLPFLRR